MHLIYIAFDIAKIKADETVDFQISYTWKDTVGQSLEKEFLVDDTAITTTYISRKLDALEKMVRKGSIAGTNGSNFPPKDTPKNKFVLDNIFFINKYQKFQVVERCQEWDQQGCKKDDKYKFLKWKETFDRGNYSYGTTT